MDRTQIYMDSGQKEALANISEQTGESQSALIRKAIDALVKQYEDKSAQRRKAFLDEYAGAWADDPELTREHFENIRAGADARAARLWGGLSDQQQGEFEGE